MITKESWGKTAAGKEVFLYTLTNQNGLSVQVTTFGARIVAVNTPDRSGKLGNIIVGPDTLEGFEAHNNFFGATIGRYGNRIAGGSFELDGHTWYYDGVNYFALPEGYTVAEDGRAYDEDGKVYAAGWTSELYDPSADWGENWLNNMN